jgi:hypothetical protein
MLKNGFSKFWKIFNIFENAEHFEKLIYKILESLKNTQILNNGFSKFQKSLKIFKIFENAQNFEIWRL